MAQNHVSTIKKYLVTVTMGHDFPKKAGRERMSFYSFTYHSFIRVESIFLIKCESLLIPVFYTKVKNMIFKYFLFYLPFKVFRLKWFIFVFYFSKIKFNKIL